MRWAIGGLLVAGGLLLVAVLLLVPRTSGTGLGARRGRGVGAADRRQRQPDGDDLPRGRDHGRHRGDGLRQLVVPAEFGGAEITDDGLTVTISDGFHLGGCTDDLAPHQFGVLVERDALPDVPFTVVVRHGDRPAVVTTIETLP